MNNTVDNYDFIELLKPYLNIAKAAKNIGILKNIMDSAVLYPEQYEGNAYFTIEWPNGKYDMISLILSDNTIELNQDIESGIKEKMGYEDMSLDEFKQYLSKNKKNNDSNKAVDELSGLLEEITNKKITTEVIENIPMEENIPLQEKLNEFFNRNPYEKLVASLNKANNMTESLRLTAAMYPDDWNGNEVDLIKEKLKKIFKYFTEGSGIKKKTIKDRANDFLNSDFVNLDPTEGRGAPAFPKLTKFATESKENNKELIKEWFAMSKFKKLLKVLDNCADLANDVYTYTNIGNKKLNFDAKEVLGKIKSIWKTFNIVKGASGDNVTFAGDEINKLSVKPYLKAQSQKIAPQPELQKTNPIKDKISAANQGVKNFVNNAPSNQEMLGDIKKVGKNIANTVGKAAKKVGTGIKNIATSAKNSFLDSLSDDDDLETNYNEKLKTNESLLKEVSISQNVEYGKMYKELKRKISLLFDINIQNTTEDDKYLIKSFIQMEINKYKSIKNIEDLKNIYSSMSEELTNGLKWMRKMNFKPKEEVFENKKPSEGLTKNQKSNIVKKAEKGENIGKGNFDKVEKKVEKEYGSKEIGQKVAAASMWKNKAKHNESIDIKESLNTTEESNYTHYAINKLTNKIVTGWDYKNISPEEIKYYAKIDLKDMFPNEKLSNFTIVSKNNLEKKGLNPYEHKNWINEFESLGKEMTEYMNEAK